MKKLIILLMAFTLLAASCDKAEESAAAAGEATKTYSYSKERFEGKDSPVANIADMSVTDINGKTVSWDDYKDSTLVIVNVWTTWCGPCLNEMPDLAELHRELAEAGIAFVGITYDAVDRKGDRDSEVCKAAQTIAASSNVTYNLLVPDEALLTGFLQDIAAFPTTYFADGEGNIVSGRIEGAFNKESWEMVIGMMLERVS